MAKKIKSLTGFHDIYGEQYDYFNKIKEVVFKNAKTYGFEGFEMPVLENTELFARGIGSSTDVVEKEMFSFKTKGGDNVSLRPEGTASIVRSYIENGMHVQPQPVKFFYFSPFFRYERPQAGRFRQFWQFGFEAIGKCGPVIDAQIIVVCYNILQELGVKGVVVQINSMGDERCRGDYKKVLRKHLKDSMALLCTDCKKRMKSNPLRCLDCKVCHKVKEEAPQIIDYICDTCKDNFKMVLEFLEELKIPYELNPFVVRGLDYYSETVYEFTAPNKEGEGLSLAVGGGGRYDGLSALLGDEERPATGAAIGVERVIALMREEGVKIEKEQPDVFIAQLGDLAKKKCLVLFEEMKKTNITVAENFGQDSLKGQLGKANKMGAKIGVIIGKEEAADDRAIVRNMRTGEQDKVKIQDVVKHVRENLKKIK